jgi:hypothetical protein
MFPHYLKFALVLLLNTLVDPKHDKFTVKITFQCQDIYQIFSHFKIMLHSSRALKLAEDGTLISHFEPLV